ncbi:MAG: hypothetical protein QNJ97_02160 [Myxococcota bacterium]|nr:hypothetical protein [Myxococcota bacterium]
MKISFAFGVLLLCAFICGRLNADPMDGSLFCSGHGDVDHNRGFMRLEGDKLWREDLMGFLSDSRAGVNHVIIDACKSFFL